MKSIKISELYVNILIYLLKNPPTVYDGPPSFRQGGHNKGDLTCP